MPPANIKNPQMRSAASLREKNLAGEAIIRIDISLTPINMMTAITVHRGGSPDRFIKTLYTEEGSWGQGFEGYL